MLDAAHGDTVRASEPPKRAHAFRPEVERAGVEIAGRKRRRKPPMPARTDNIQGSRLVAAVARSKRKKQSLKGMRRRVWNNGLCYECRCVYFVRNVGRSLRGTLAGLRCGRLRPAWLEEPNDDDCKSFARAGCGGRAFSASRPRAQGLPYQKEPAGHACHNCHVEQSGSTNAASAEAACRLCLARRKKTNEVQSRIYEGQSGIRFFVALLLRMTNYFLIVHCEF